MTTLAHADIFFFISTILYIIFFGVLIVGAIYVVGILKNVRHISQKLEGDVDTLSADAREFFADIRESMVYRMIFGRKRRIQK